MSVRIRQPVLREVPPGGAVNAILAAATLSASATKADGSSGSVSRTLAAVTLSSSGVAAVAITGSLTQTLSPATLSSGDGARQQIYQEIWIIEGEKPKKRVKRAKKRARDAVQRIENAIEEARKLAEQGQLKARQLAATKATIEQQFSLIESQYRLLEAESRLSRSLETARAQAEAVFKAQMAAVESVRRQVVERMLAQRRAEIVERARIEQEELDDLNNLLSYLMNEV